MRDYIFASICKVLDQGNITYVKWDMNRSISDVYSHVSVRGTVLHDYVVGVYDFLEQMIQRYPELLIEDAAAEEEDSISECCIIHHRYGAVIIQMRLIEPKFNTEHHSFIRHLQVGSHVSAVPNHQTGRITSLKLGQSLRWQVLLDMN